MKNCKTSIIKQQLRTLYLEPQPEQHIFNPRPSAPRLPKGLKNIWTTFWKALEFRKELEQTLQVLKKLFFKIPNYLLNNYCCLQLKKLKNTKKNFVKYPTIYFTTIVVPSSHASPSMTTRSTSSTATRSRAFKSELFLFSDLLTRPLFPFLPWYQQKRIPPLLKTAPSVWRCVPNSSHVHPLQPN